MRHENEINKNEYRVCNRISFLFIFSKYRFMFPAFEYISPACKCVWGFDQLYLDVHCLQEIKTGCPLFGKAVPCSSVSIFVPCIYLYIWIKSLNPGNTYTRELNWVSIGTGSGLWIFCAKSFPESLVSVDINVYLTNRVIDMYVILYFAMLKCIMQLASPLRPQYANAQKTIVSRGIYLMMQSKYHQQIQSISIWRYAVGVTKAQCFTVTVFFCSWFVIFQELEADNSTVIFVWFKLVTSLKWEIRVISTDVSHGLNDKTYYTAI